MIPITILLISHLILTASNLLLFSCTIFFNGAMLKDIAANQVLETRTLEEDLWRTFAARILYQFPRACVEVYTAEQCNIISPEENDDPRLEDEFDNVRPTTLRAVEDETWG